jgi:hypothetical protein
MPPRRQIPTVGAPVTVAFLARRVAGTVEDVAADGRDVSVLTEEGELIAFALNQATGYFTAGGLQEGARLLFEGR